MTPTALRAAIASARLRPRMYGTDAHDLSGYLHGLTAGVYDGPLNVAAQWQSAWTTSGWRPNDPRADDVVCDVADRVVAALWPQGDAPAPPLSPDQVAAWRRNSDALSGAYVDARAEIDRLTAEEERLRAESAARLACADHVRDEIRAAAKSADVPGGDEVATAKRMANCIRRLRAQVAAAQPVLVLDAIRNGRFVTMPCGGCNAPWPEEGAERCPACGWALAQLDTDLCPKCGALDLDHACPKSAATLAGEAFAEQHPGAAAGIMGACVAPKGET